MSSAGPASAPGAPPTGGVPGQQDTHQRAVKICLRSVSIEYPQRRGAPLEVVRHFTLDVYDQEFVCLVGASGCGKSTLLNVVAGLLTPSEGEVFVDGRPVTGPGPDRSMVFQDDAVFPWYTVQQNVEYGLRVAYVPRAERDQRMERCLELVGLSKDRDKFPRELSGGMRKRVDVARALAMDPEVLLMDEPFASLDAITRERLQIEFLNIWQHTQMTVLFVTHDLEEAIFLADRVVVMGGLPGCVKLVVEVPIGRPRDVEVKTTPEFQLLRRDLARYLD
jgi:ABC-type nitrate/sulfonate/bicarbonate transport system ATPase subunit